ncbi:MAG: riboflavin kinase [Bacteroidota bacterium]
MNHDLNSPEVLEALAQGDMRKANGLLGSVYLVHARVVHGNHLGRTLGFPTANLELLQNKPFLPAFGVYAVKAEFNHTVYNGMANAGTRPTIDGKTMTLEVNLFDFTGDLYGKTMIVYFIDRIRDEKKFKDLDELVRQIHEDKKRALELLA